MYWQSVWTKDKKVSILYMDIDTIINMLDERTTAGVSRIKVLVDEEQMQDTVKEAYHHGRCDIGSPWADGTVGNCD